MDIYRSYELSDWLREKFAVEVEVDMDRRGDFDFFKADNWCREHMGVPRYQVRQAQQGGRSGWRLEHKWNRGKWCTFQNQYYFRFSSDAIIFKLSV